LVCSSRPLHPFDDGHAGLERADQARRLKFVENGRLVTVKMKLEPPPIEL